MCIIIKRGVLGSRRHRNSQNENRNANEKNRKQAGFTLPEMIVSLFIVLLIMHGVWQWGSVMYRTSEGMAQNRQAVVLAQQIFSGIHPQCPDDWEISVQSIHNGRMLYETQMTIKTKYRVWTFYYVGPEEVVYADVETNTE